MITCKNEDILSIIQSMGLNLNDHSGGYFENSLSDQPIDKVSWNEFQTNLSNNDSITFDNGQLFLTAFKQTEEMLKVILFP
jgi:hypothetical protein